MIQLSGQSTVTYMQFRELLNSIDSKHGKSTLSDPGDWLQGRAMFGGLQTILCLHAMRSLLPDTPLRSLQTTFVQPAKSLQVTAHANIVRAGKSVTHVESRLLDDDNNVIALVVGVFGAARESQINLKPVQTGLGNGSQRIEFPTAGGVPSFTRHFKPVWLQGTLPFTGDTETHHIVQISMPGESDCNEYHVIALADFIPPIAICHLTNPAPGSSMTWMLEFLNEDYQGLALENWRVDAELMAAGEGYTHQSVMLWGPGGEPIALSRQNMVVFG